MVARLAIFLALVPTVLVGAQRAPRLVAVDLPEPSLAVAATPPAIASPRPSEAIGLWKVDWDRSDTTWSPPHFHGTLRIDREVAVHFRENGPNSPIVDTVELDGPNVRITMHFADRRSGTWEIVGSVQGDRLLAYMQTSGGERTGVPWSPFTGTRVIEPTSGFSAQGLDPLTGQRTLPFAFGAEPTLLPVRTPARDEP